MSAISQASCPVSHALLRSLLPRNQQMHVPDSNRRRRRHHEQTALHVASHLAMTSLLFLVLVMAVWIASWGVHLLNSVHPFPAEFLRFLRRLEIGLVYADGTLICITLLNGMWLYVLDILRGHS